MFSATGATGVDFLEFPLPPLRQDLGLFPAPRNSRGEATWSLHDPLRNRYFRIGEREFLLLSHWVPGETIGMLLPRVVAVDQTVSAEEVAGLLDFLVRSELTDGDASLAKRLFAAYKNRQHSLWHKILHNYLFLRLPLVRPDPWLDRLYPVLRPLLSRRFAQVTALAGLLGLVLVVRQWDLFLSTFLGFLSWQGAASFGLALILVKVLHETGHALACRHFGIRVPTIGVVFIVMWPVMYTDATEAWRLTSRRARIWIAGAGMLTELSIACYATLLWVLLPDGLLRSVVFTLATTTWLMSLAVNLNPLMKFDGYYLFADILDIPNLQDRGFELARNRLRHVLFGIPRVSDPGLLPHEQRIAILWAYATWLYRFFLFLGIAVLVYVFFFKALGIFLFLVEIWWFVAAPIWREVRGWRQLAGRLDARRRKAYLLGGGALLLVLAWPWESSFEVSGIMRAAEQQRLFPAADGRVGNLHVGNGDRVLRGQLLMELTSPDLDAELVRARARVSAAEYELLRVTTGDNTSDRLVAEQGLAQARAEQAAVEARAASLQLVAPVDGVVRDIPEFVRPGLWVGQKQFLGAVVGDRAGYVVDAYVTEDYLRFVHEGDAVRFYPDDLSLPPLDGQVTELDRVDARILPEPMLAEAYGGSIPARLDGEGNVVPEQALYRARVALADDGETVPAYVVRGQARFSGDTRSLLARAWTFVAGALLRESGF